MAIGNSLRFKILSRDGFSCHYCGGAAPDKKLEVDHIVPVSKGGGDEEENLITACKDCNIGKFTKTVEKGSGFDPEAVAERIAKREEAMRSYYKQKGAQVNRISIELNDILDYFGGLDTRAHAHIKGMLEQHGYYNTREALEIAMTNVGRAKNKMIPYAYGILRNWARQEAEDA